MCELLAMGFNSPVTPQISFTGFQHRAQYNPHGWGLAFYPDRSAIVFKEPFPGHKSHLADFVKQYNKITSRVILSHVRVTSRGKIAYQNSHPFCRELNGKHYTFAHNGTLSGYKRRFSLGSYNPIGETDSEHAFCWLMDQIKNKMDNTNQNNQRMSSWNWKKQDIEWLHSQLRHINELGNFNCIFTDGDFLFCYFDSNGYNSLKYVQRNAPYGPITLKDEDFTINLADEKQPNESGIIIATNRLTDENWIDFLNGQLIVISNGKIIYS